MLKALSSGTCGNGAGVATAFPLDVAVHRPFGCSHGGWNHPESRPLTTARLVLRMVDQECQRLTHARNDEKVVVLRECYEGGPDLCECRVHFRIEICVAQVGRVPAVFVPD